MEAWGWACGRGWGSGWWAGFRGLAGWLWGVADDEGGGDSERHNTYDSNDGTHRNQNERRDSNADSTTHIF